MSSMTYIEVINAVSSDLKKCLLVEGAPLSYGDNAASVEKVFKTTKGSRRLEEIARLLDYRLAYENNCALLIKNYTSPKELPSISFDELYTFCKDLMPICKQYSPPYWERGPVPPSIRGKQEFFKSLTSSQWKAACSEGITVAQLAPNQARILSKVVASSYIGGHYTYLSELLSTLDGVRQGEFAIAEQGLVLQWQTQFGSTASKTIDKSPNTLTIKNGYGLEPTIYQLQEYLKARSQAEQGCAYEACLLEKPLIRASNANLSAVATGKLVSTLYGLRTEARINGLLVRPNRIPGRVTPQDFRDALLKALPDPLLRSIIPKNTASARTTSISPSKTTHSVPWRVDLVCEASRQFLAKSITERLRNQKGKPISFSNLTPREKAALALWLSKDYLEWCAPQLYEVPRYISEFNNLKIQCEQYIGMKQRPMVIMQLMSWNERGKVWRMAIGWGDVWDISRS